VIVYVFTGREIKNTPGPFAVAGPPVILMQYAVHCSYL